MKKTVLVLAAAAAVLPALGQSSYFVAGDFQGWTPGITAMTQVQPGIWQVSLTGLSAGRHEFKITGIDWSWSYPGANSWFYAPDGSVTVTYDVNSHADGWLSASQRIGLSTDPGTWTAAGDFEGWNNAAGNMVSLGGGIYEYVTVLTPGDHKWKAVVTGTWDSISLDSRSVGTADWAFTVTADATTAHFYVNALNGTAKLELVPEPSSVALLGGGLALGLLGLRRRQ